MSNTLYVGNLAPSITEEALLGVFASVGGAMSARVAGYALGAAGDARAARQLTRARAPPAHPLQQRNIREALWLCHIQRPGCDAPRPRARRDDCRRTAHLGFHLAQRPRRRRRRTRPCLVEQRAADGPGTKSHARAAGTCRAATPHAASRANAARSAPRRAPTDDDARCSPAHRNAFRGRSTRRESTGSSTRRRCGSSLATMARLCTSSCAAT